MDVDEARHRVGGSRIRRIELDSVRDLGESDREQEYVLILFAQLVFEPNRCEVIVEGLSVRKQIVVERREVVDTRGDLLLNPLLFGRENPLRPATQLLLDLRR